MSNATSCRAFANTAFNTYRSRGEVISRPKASRSCGNAFGFVCVAPEGVAGRMAEMVGQPLLYDPGLELQITDVMISPELRHGPRS
jgi:hypothetical protein